MTLELCARSRLWPKLETIRCSEGVEENHGNLGQDSRCSGQERANAQINSMHFLHSVQTVPTTHPEKPFSVWSFHGSGGWSSFFYCGGPACSCEICSGQRGPGAGFSSSTSLFPCQNHSKNFLCVILTGRQRDETREPSKKQCSFRYRGAFDRKVLSLLKKIAYIYGSLPGLKVVGE